MIGDDRISTTDEAHQLSVVEMVELKLDPEFSDGRRREDVWHPLDEEGRGLLGPGGRRAHAHHRLVLLQEEPGGDALLVGKGSRRS